MNLPKHMRVNSYGTPVRITVRNEAHDPVETIRSALSTASDRPLSPSLLIARACRIASDKRAFNAEDVSRALHEELTERGWLLEDVDATEET